MRDSNSTGSIAASAAAAAAAMSARTTSQSRAKPLDDRSVNSTPAAAGNRGHPSKISSLYSANSNSFKPEPSFIDLTSTDVTPNKITEPVYFAEDDFSDDADLDLDFEAPSALPVQPKPPVAKENFPPPSTSRASQVETLIPWSSSPVSHMRPPLKQHAVSAASDMSRPPLKRDSSSEVETIDAPVPKKVKKRVLPASFHQQDSLEHQEKQVTCGLSRVEPSTPAQKSRGFWDSSASAIKEQKKILKNQNNSRTTDNAGNNDSAMVPTLEKMHDVEEKAAKAVPISLSSEQEHVLDMVVNQGQSVFFTGPAGAGKSVLMRAIIQELKRKYSKDPERVAVTASTGLAACNIGGITLHSFSGKQLPSPLCFGIYIYIHTRHPIPTPHLKMMHKSSRGEDEENTNPESKGIGLGKEPASNLIKKIRRNPKAKNRWLRTKCLIIDEISMVDGDLFDKLSTIGRTMRNNGRPWGGIQLIITGDFFQLPPVPDSDKRDVKFAFDAATWSTSIDHTIGLTQVFRQRDPEFAAMLNEMRVGKISQKTVDAFKALSRPLKFDDGVDTAELYPTRAQVEASNEKRLRDLPGKAYRYEAMDSGDPAIRDKLLVNMMAPKALELKVGAQVMLIKNLDESLVNGSLGKVIAFSDEKTFEMGNSAAFDDPMEDSMAKARRKLAAFSRDADSPASSHQYPVVQFISTGGVPRVLLCQPEEWKVELPSGEVQAKRNQLPLILAWALSIHKAQGQTLERVTVNLGKVFENGQAYVALSRATTQQGLRVLGFDRSKVMAHQKVVEFYEKLYSVADAAKVRPSSIAGFIVNKRGTTASAQKPQATRTSMDDDEEAMATYGY